MGSSENRLKLQYAKRLKKVLLAFFLCIATVPSRVVYHETLNEDFWESLRTKKKGLLTHYQTTNFGLFQTERRQFQI